MRLDVEPSVTSLPPGGTPALPLLLETGPKGLARPDGSHLTLTVSSFNGPSLPRHRGSLFHMAHETVYILPPERDGVFVVVPGFHFPGLELGRFPGTLPGGRGSLVDGIIIF